ncbi:MAG: hypothetical protein AAF288_02425 [Planctomycetota bacterium]
MSRRVLNVADSVWPSIPAYGRWIWVPLLLMSFWAAPADAGTRSYGQVTVNVQPPAPGESQYGYAVYRMSVTNRGDTPRSVTVVMPAESWSYGDSVGRLSRTVTVEPGSTAVAELLQPPLPVIGNDAQVVIDGETQRDPLPVALVDHMDSYTTQQPILISNGVIGPATTSFEEASTDDAEAWDTSSGGSGSSPLDSLARLARSGAPVSEWSGNWLAYSRFLMVIVSEQELRDAPLTVDSALRDFVASGGTVAVLGPGEETPKLAASWTRAALPEAGRVGGRPSELRLGLGKVRLLPVNRLAGFDPGQWADWIGEVADENRPRTLRLDPDDAERRLPMVESLQVPARGLFALMLLFTVLIGPANFLILWWLKRRMWLLWTIPTIALAFASLVLAYSIYSEGVEPRARTVAITVLDQTTRQSVTLAMTGYYAPLTPGEGLRFSDRTEVTPQTGSYNGYGYYNESYSGRERSIDVSNGQHLQRGWIVARVPAHLSLRNVESRRERLEITRGQDGDLSVVNGLGLPIARLLIADAQGDQYEVTNIAPGASGIARATGWQGGYGAPAIDLCRQYGVAVSSTAERLRSDPEAYLTPLTYLAFLDNTSFSEPGLVGLTEHETTGIVVGRWRGAE